MKEQLLRKLQDKRFIASMLALMLAFMSKYGLFVKLGIPEGMIKDVIDFVLFVLAGFGIVIDTPVESEGK